MKKLITILALFTVFANANANAIADDTAPSEPVDCFYESNTALPECK